MKKIPLYKQGIEFEPLAYRENGTRKALTYDQSLERLRAAGYERHPQPAEVFSLFADNLEGKLDAQEKAIVEDMLMGGEWLSRAIQVVHREQGIFLNVYRDPEGLEKNNGREFKYTEKTEYDLTQLVACDHGPLKTMSVWAYLHPFADLNQFPDMFVGDICGRSFVDLPEKMRDGVNRVIVNLPPDNDSNIYYLSLGRWSQSQIDYFDASKTMASRGVRTPVSPSETYVGVPKKSTENG